MDDGGFIFGDAPRISGSAFLTFYGFDGTNTPVIGSQYLDQEHFSDLGQLYQSLQTSGINISSITIKPEGVREASFVNGGKLIFKDSQKPLDLALAVETINEKTSLLKRNATTTLEYIDMRLGSRIFYKLSGDNAVQVKK